MTDILLNLGCGTRIHPVWQNLDLVPMAEGVEACDLSKGIPRPDACCAAVYHSHVLEHLRPEHARGFLVECRRVLRPGGILRVAVPDLEGICRAYLAALDGDRVDEHEWMVLELLDQMVRERSGGRIAAYLRQANLPNESFVFDRVGQEARVLRKILKGEIPAPHSPCPTTKPAWKERLRAWLLDRLLTPTQWREMTLGRFRMGGETHQWMYDRLSLGTLLAEAGFDRIRKASCADSDIPAWPSYQLDAEANGRPYKPDSLYMEARRPS